MSNKKQRGKKIARGRARKRTSINRNRRQSASLCDSLAEIAQKLTSHYRNRDGTSQLRFEIDRRTVSLWKSGLRIDKSPPPPARVNSRQWDAKLWIAWFHKWLYPKWKISTNGQANSQQDLFALKQQDELEALQQKQWQRNKERGQFISIDEHNRTAMELGLMVNRALTEYGEKELSQRLLQSVQSLNLPDEKRQALVECIKDMARQSVNSLRERIKQLVTDSTRKEGGE
jgi:hypothetical protein